ncbi:hypothetical protein V6Z11_A12G150100 [Gossypium hirsutum]
MTKFLPSELMGETRVWKKITDTIFTTTLFTEFPLNVSLVTLFAISHTTRGVHGRAESGPDKILGLFSRLEPSSARNMGLKIYPSQARNKIVKLEPCLARPILNFFT